MQLDNAIRLIRENAERHSEKRPTFGTLMEEVAELTLALRGKHEHPPELELVQIGGIVANMLCRYPDAGAVGE